MLSWIDWVNKKRNRNKSSGERKRRRERKRTLRQEQLEDRQLLMAAPVATLPGLPTDVMIGEETSITALFDNTDAVTTGYGPYIDLFLDTTGPDGEFTAPPDGITLSNFDATYLGAQLPRTDLITLSGPTYVHPLTGLTTSPPAGFQDGDTVAVLTLPFGSFTAGQPAAAIDVSLGVSDLADMGTALNVSAVGGFRFGETPADDPIPDPPIRQTGSTSSQIDPILWTLEKTYLGPEDETATGPNYKRDYRLEVDIATGQTIDLVTITDTLADSMQWTGAANVVMTVHGSTIATNVTGSTATTVLPGGTVVGNFGTVLGQDGPDTSLQLEFFVPRDDRSGSEILPQNSVTGTDSVLDTNTGHADGTWAPIDVRDLPSPQPVSIVLPANAHELQEHSLATQKSVTPVDPVTGLATSSIIPGTTLLRYDIDFQVSDYYAFQNVFLEDIMSDGQRLYLGAVGVGVATPTLQVDNAYDTAPVTRSNSSTAVFSDPGSIDFSRRYFIEGTTRSDPTTYSGDVPASPIFSDAGVGTIDGTTFLRFNISQELIARGFDGGLLVGGDIRNGGSADSPLNGNPTLFGAAQGTITFYTEVKEEFSDDFPSGDNSVDQLDVLGNTVPLIQGDQLDAADLVGVIGQGTDNTGASVALPAGTGTKVLHAVNSQTTNLPYGPDNLVAVQAGDLVTYKLTYTLPTSDFENLQIIDFPPLPVLAVPGTATFSTLGGIPPVNEVTVGPDDTYFATFGFGARNPTITTDTVNNSITMDFGSFDDIPLHRATTIDLLLTLQVGPQAFASDLFLTNQMRVNEDSTNAGSTLIDQIVRFELVQPEVDIQKGVVGYNSTGLTLGGIGFNAPGAATTFTGGPVFSSAQATAIGGSDLGDAAGEDVDADDDVRYAIVVQNQGRGDAYDVNILDVVPAEYDRTTFTNLAVRRGDGALLTAGTDYTFAYSAVSGALDITLTDNYTSGNTTDPSADARSGALSRGAADDGSTPITNGSNTIVISYDVTLATDVAPNEAIVNTSAVASFSSSEGGEDLTDPSVVSGAVDPSDTATVITKSPIPDKTLDGTEITEPGNNAATQATVGEWVTYTLTVTVPEGEMTNARVVDTLDSGLVFVDVTAVAASGALSFASGGLPTVGATPTNTTITSSGRVVTFDFGTITNSNSNNATDETITITYRAVVSNATNNQAGATRNNSAVLSWTGNALPAVQAADVTLVEPTLSTLKEVRNVSAGGSFSSLAAGDADDAVEYRITISNANASTDTTAFDISLNDLIPSFITAPAISTVTSTGAIRFNGSTRAATPADFQLVAGTLSVNPAVNVDMEKNSSIEIVVSGTYTGSTGQEVSNTAEVRWSSLDGTVVDRSIHNTSSDERDGSDGNLGGGSLNDYRVSSTADIESPPLVRKQLVDTSEAHTTGSGVAVGEIVRYRLTTSIGEGQSDNFQVRDVLPVGLAFLNDSSARFAFISSTGTNITSATITGLATGVTGGGIAGDESTLPTLTPATITGTFNDNNVFTSYTGAGTGEASVYSSGTDVYFRFGDLTNADRDGSVEYVVIEFNALVRNETVIQSGTNRDNDYTVLVDTDGNGSTGYVSVVRDNNGDGVRSAGDTSITAIDADNNAATGPNTLARSAAVSVTVREPNLAIVKQATATTGSVVSYEVVVTNTGNATAFEAVVSDVLPAALDLEVATITITPTGGATTGTANHDDLSNRMEFNSLTMPALSTLTITYDANIVTPGVTITNTANTNYTSLPGPNGTGGFHGSSTPGATGSATGERDGSDGVGLLNDYVAADSESLGSLGDVVWYDINGNGALDGLDTGIPNATVTVRWFGPDGIEANADDSVIVTTTNSSGAYLVSGLPLGLGPDNYRVTVSAFPNGLTVPTHDLDGIGTADTSLVALTSGNANPRDVDFGYRGAASIGDRVWIDSDGDGSQGLAAEEPGLPSVGITVTWFGFDNAAGGGDDITYNTTTNAGGAYGVSNLPSGNYRVDVVSGLPGNVTQTFDLTGPLDDSATRTLGIGEAAINVDFGYEGMASIGDTVWYDVDGDTTQNNAEPGISGASVVLVWAGPDGALGSGDDVFFVRTTAADGSYGFPGLPVFGTDDPYRVTVSPPAAYATQTFDDDGLGTPNQSTHNLGASENNTDQDFGYRGALTQGLGNFVFEDLNGNGRQDGSEPGINGVDIELYDATGVNLLATTTTAGGGAYSFPGLTPGNYQVFFADNDGTTTYIRAAANSPVAVEATDSDASETTGFTGPVTVAAATFNNDVDAGLYLEASVGNRIWYDVDGNGIQVLGEPGINGATVLLDYAGLDGVFGTGDDALGVASDVTSGDGDYSFTNLRPGTYRTRINTGTLPNGITDPTFDFDGLLTANQATFTLTSGQNRTDIDHGYQGTGEIGDLVWNDQNADTVQDAGEPGIPSVNVTLLWAGFDGSFGGGDDISYNATTNGGGIYGFPNLPSGLFTVDVVDATLPANLNLTTPPDPRNVTLAIGETNNAVDFGYEGPTAEVGDTVWYDADGDGTQNNDEPGISGVTVTLLFGGADGDLATTADNITYVTTTDASGNYNFNGLPVGAINGTDPNYQVTISGLPAIYTAQTYDLDGTGTPHVAGFQLMPAQVRDDVDFGYGGTASLGDFVFEDLNGSGRQDGGEPGIDGLAVELYDATGTLLLAATTTAGGGFYSFPGLVAGDYRVLFASPAGFVFTAADVGADTIDSDADATGLSPVIALPTGVANSTVDAGVYEPITVGDFVWYDIDGNSVQDTGEPGIPGADVTLMWLGPDGAPGGGDDQVFTDTTDGNGAYSISNLPPGNYTAAVSGQPAGLTVQTIGVPSFSLISGTDRDDIDFGFQGPGALGDRVWYDLNRDGADVGEPGVSGVTVQATWFGFDGLPSPADNIVHTMVTGITGGYGFSDLPLGAYEVIVNTGTVPPDLVATYDLDSGTTSPDSVTGATLTALVPSENGADFGYTGQRSLGDRVWLDFNGDGLQDTDEPGLSGVTVTLTWAGEDGNLATTGDNAVLTRTTGSTGDYLFSDLPQGFYQAQVTAGLPPGLTNTGDPDATLDGLTTVTLTSTDIDTVDFGYQGDSSLAGFVYRDFNVDGIRQPAGANPETGIDSVTVTLTGTDINGNSITRTDLTPADGSYLFEGLLAGTYQIIETQPASVFGAGTAGFYDGLDTVGTIGGTPTGTNLTKNELDVTLGTGEDGIEYNFGENPPADPFGYVYVDIDESGTRDPGEPGIPGVTVTISGTAFPGTPLQRPLTAADVPGGLTTTTDASGFWEFPIVPPGVYSLVETHPTGFLDGLEENADPNGPHTVIISNDRFDNVELNPFPIRGPFNFGELGFDFGDAPDTYQTTLASDGARHIAGSGLDFGTPADRETDGQPSAGAVGDDTDTDGDDEGGVTIPHLRQGHDATVTVDATAAGFVDGFIDYNADGDFADAGEKVVNSIAVTAGSNDLTFPVPASIPGATTYARFRISSAGGLGYDGFAADGEVEDHQVQIGLSMTGGPLTPGINTFVIQNGTPGCLVNLAVGTTPGSAFLPDYGITLGIADPVIVGQGLIGPTGESIIQFTIPAGFSGTDLLFQSFEHGDNNPQLSNVMTVSVPLLAVGGEGPGAAAITQAEVDALLPVARQQWEATGLTAQQQARLEAATVELADVPDARLGQTADTTIFIDDTAAGYGWFVDVTPNSDSEFSFTGTNQLSAANGSTAFGKHDLLTVLVHELGHVLGREHAAEDPQDVMAEMLPTGTRRLTDGAEANFDFSGQIEFNQNAGGEFDIVITGTPDSDAFEFVAGEQHHLVSLNGEQLHLASDAVSSIDFRGAGGEDSALLTGSSGDDMVRLYPHRAVLTAADFEVNLREMGSIEVLAGEGVDRASMYDSIGNDQFYGRPEFSRLVGDGFENKATGFDSVFVYASAGGDSDFAYLYDDFSSDRLIARPGLARLFGDSFFNEVRFFDRVYAYATAGGEPDYAYLYDSIGDDVLIARPEHTRMTGDGFFNDARDFDRVYAYATAGGEADMAYMYDSIGNDKFFGKPEVSRLQGDGFFNDAWSFDSVYAYATAGGTADYAYLYDSPGADDFIGRPEYAQLSGDEFFNKVHSFDRVYAHATAGGEDHAYQYDSTGNDRYIGRPGSALMYGDDFFNDARHFERVNAYASAGGSDDRATMTKIESADSLFGRDNFGMLTGPDRYERIFHFDSLRAYAKDGHTGHADVSGVDYFFQQIGDWE